MELQLSGKAEEIVREKLALGIYADAAEFVSEIILRAEEFDKLKLEKLCQALRIGIDQVDRGEGIQLDIDRINKKIDKELAAKSNDGKKRYDLPDIPYSYHEGKHVIFFGNLPMA